MTTFAAGTSSVRGKYWFAMALLAVSSPGGGQLSGGDFELREAALTAGGGQSARSEFEVHGSIGQALVNRSSGGPFEVFGGIWTPESSDFLFSDSWED